MQQCRWLESLLTLLLCLAVLIKPLEAFTIMPSHTVLKYTAAHNIVHSLVSPPSPYWSFTLCKATIYVEAWEGRLTTTLAVVERAMTYWSFTLCEATIYVAGTDRLSTKFPDHRPKYKILLLVDARTEYGGNRFIAWFVSGEFQKRFLTRAIDFCSNDVKNLKKM